MGEWVNGCGAGHVYVYCVGIYLRLGTDYDRGHEEEEKIKQIRDVST